MKAFVVTHFFAGIAGSFLAYAITKSLVAAAAGFFASMTFMTICAVLKDD